MIPFALLLQAALPTVGDTIWIERSLEVPVGAEVRASAWSPGGMVTLLGRAVLRREGGRIVVAYPAAAWSAGRHLVRVPGPVLIRPDGTTDSLPEETRLVEVRSVLPSDQPPDQIAPQPQTGIIAQRITTPWPLVVLLLLAGGMVAGLRWWWHRRGPPAGSPRLTTPAANPPLDEWSEDGEHRAVAAVAAGDLRWAMVRRLPGVPAGVVTSRLIRIVTEQKPGWPAEEIATLLRALESAQFAETPGAEVVELAQRTRRLVARLERAA